MDGRVMAKEWTDEEVNKEIARAIRIVREDRYGGESPPSKTPDGPPAPPAKPEPTEEPKKARKGIWWGDALEDASLSDAPTEPPKEGSNA